MAVSRRAAFAALVTTPAVAAEGAGRDRQGRPLIAGLGERFETQPVAGLG